MDVSLGVVLNIGGLSMTSVYSAGEYHLPERNMRYPYKIVDYPWPLCGLVSPGCLPAWSDEDVDCDKCRRLSEWRDAHHPVEQLSLFDTLEDS